ncbi:NapC/NirT family cytochrome c [Aeromonas diversa]|uniref:NapC/NirT family cytochrome c n=1 Tax=Aeromonas diversa TaxID=502790 RepID=UPI0039A1EA67
MSDKPSLWRRLWTIPGARWRLGVPLGGLLAFLLGAIALAGFNGVLTYTNSNEFCYSCHLGMDSIVAEYHASAHFKNTQGVVAATCGDCHVPHELLPKLWVKIRATKDIYLRLKGEITPDNFDKEHRARLAAIATTEFKESDSHTCRFCHDPARMDLENQSKVAARRHKGMVARGETCIDCHAGIAHQLPRSE